MARATARAMARAMAKVHIAWSERFWTFVREFKWLFFTDVFKRSLKNSFWDGKAGPPVFFS